MHSICIYVFIYTYVFILKSEKQAKIPVIFKETLGLHCCFDHAKYASQAPHALAELESQGKC